MWLPSANSLLAWDPTLSLHRSSSSATCEMPASARSSRSHSSRGSSWSVLGTVRAAVLAMVAFAPRRMMGQTVTTRDDGDVIDHSGLVMTTMQDTRLFSVILNQLPAPRLDSYTRVCNYLFRTLLIFGRMSANISRI